MRNSQSGQIGFPCASRRLLERAGRRRWHREGDPDPAPRRTRAARHAHRGASAARDGGPRGRRGARSCAPRWSGPPTCAGLLARNIAQARQVARQLLEGRLICQPFEDAENRGYAFTATGTYRRLGVPQFVNVGGGPNGICHLVGQFLRFPFKGTALRS